MEERFVFFRWCPVVAKAGAAHVPGTAEEEVEGGLRVTLDGALARNFATSLQHGDPRWESSF